MMYRHPLSSMQHPSEDPGMCIYMYRMCYVSVLFVYKVYTYNMQIHLFELFPCSEIISNGCFAGYVHCLLKITWMELDVQLRTKPNQQWCRNADIFLESLGNLGTCLSHSTAKRGYHLSWSRRAVFNFRTFHPLFFQIHNGGDRH